MNKHIERLVLGWSLVILAACVVAVSALLVWLILLAIKFWHQFWYGIGAVLLTVIYLVGYIFSLRSCREK
jgi:hypothetical protein